VILVREQLKWPKLDFGGLNVLLSCEYYLFGDLNGDSIGMLDGRKFQFLAEKCM
jgi:hypothetical protein